MLHLKQAWARLTSSLRRRELDRDFDEEARSHLEFAADDWMRRGLPEAEARRMARVEFGAIEACKDTHRDARGLAWLNGLICDFRFSLRSLRRESALSRPRSQR